MAALMTRWLNRVRPGHGATDADPDSGTGTNGGAEVDGSATPDAPAANPKSPGLRTGVGAWLNKPMTSFHLIVAVAALLTTLGLIMVLSASGVHSYDSDGSPWTIFAKQVLWTVIGLVGFYIAVRLPVALLRRLAFPGFVVAVLLLILVLIPGIGTLSNGSRSWFVVAGFSMQPSELAKIAFLIWGAHLLASRRMERASLREMLIPLVPGAFIAAFLIVLEPDLGQTISLGIILLALLWYAGLPLKVFISSSLAILVAGAVLALAEGYRSVRVQSWLDPSADAQGAGYQARQAKFALANGGIFGDGLGQGTAKYNYLPNAHNDFIFAIVGEELGFIGAFGLLCLFALFAYTGMRIARRSADPFLRLLTATATFWTLSQVFINVGYVVGLLPVTGLQLPLISAGGTSTATELFVIGLIANAARHEPEAVAALRAGREDRMNRLLRLPLPEPYVPTRVEALRDRLRTENGTRRATKTPAKKSPAKKSPAKKSPVKKGRAHTAKGRSAVQRDSVPARRATPPPVRSRSRAASRSRASERADEDRARGSVHHGDRTRNTPAQAVAQGRTARGRKQPAGAATRSGRSMEGQRHG